MINPRSTHLFHRLFWAGSVGLVTAGLWAADWSDPTRVAAGGVVGTAALLPAYLWARGVVVGLPIYPIVSLNYVLTCATPLVQGHPAVTGYPPSDQLAAAGTVVGALLLGAVGWYAGSARDPNPDPPSTYWGFPDRPNGVHYLLFLGLGCLVESPVLRPLTDLMPWSVYRAVQTGVLALAVLSSTVLSFQWGRGLLTPAARCAFAALLFVYLVLACTGLLLHVAGALILTVAAAYTLGRGRLPLLFLTAGLGLLGALHVGKWPMREAYWGPDPKPFPGYLAFYQEWAGHSLAELDPHRVEADRSRRRADSALTRSSIIHMVLLVQTKSPDVVPFLDGETYALIPAALVPRLLDPDKVGAHEGTYLLSIRYGLQTREATRHTTIGFGLVAEAYANFGLPGVAGFAVLFGWATGAAGRVGVGYPVTSFRGLFGLIVLSAVISAEPTAGIVVCSVVQGTVSLAAVGLVMMRRLPYDPAAGPPPGAS